MGLLYYCEAVSFNQEIFLVFWMGFGVRFMYGKEESNKSLEIEKNYFVGCGSGNICCFNFYGLF